MTHWPTSRQLGSRDQVGHDRYANMVSRLADGRQIADLRDSAPAGPIRSLGRATGDQAGDVVDEGTATAAKRRSRRAA